MFPSKLHEVKIKAGVSLQQHNYRLNIKLVFIATDVSYIHISAVSIRWRAIKCRSDLEAVVSFTVCIYYTNMSTFKGHR